MIKFLILFNIVLITTYDNIYNIVSQDVQIEKRLLHAAKC